MAKAELKTKLTTASVKAFLDGIKDETRRKDAKAVAALMKRATKSPPRMWGSSIVGFGTYHYKYASGREGDWFVAGFSPRKANLTLYILPGLHLHTANLKKLGTFTTGKSCIYIKRLADIRLPVLEAMVKQARGRV
jgi:hypothetical protein